MAKKPELEVIAEVDELIAGNVDEATAMLELGVIVTQYFTDTPKSFMLGEPQQLTVKKKTGGYTKRPHIGGENFRPSGAYAGKRGALIFIMRPLDVADYECVEMSEKEATKLLPGFKEYIKDAAGGFNAAMKEANKVSAAAAELAKNADKFETYADIGFGSF